MDDANNWKDGFKAMKPKMSRKTVKAYVLIDKQTKKDAFDAKDRKYDELKLAYNMLSEDTAKIISEQSRQIEELRSALTKICWWATHSWYRLADEGACIKGGKYCPHCVAKEALKPELKCPDFHQPHFSYQDARACNVCGKYLKFEWKPSEQKGEREL